MHVVSPASHEPAPVTAATGPGHHDGVPRVFAGCHGFLHPAEGRVGVVLCSPWGFEDLILRKGWRLLAEAIAAAGFPCIRFDYPGTGNAPGGATDVRDVAEWIDAVGAAADLLKAGSDADTLILVGQSLGATLAVEAARKRGDVVGLQLIAPVVKGRPYVRELAATASLVADKIGIRIDLAADEGLDVLGFSMSHAMVASVRALDLAAVDALAVRDVILFDQPERRASAALAEHLRRLGADVRLEAVAPFHLMVSDATAIQPLPVAAERVVAALRRVHPARPPSEPVRPPRPSMPPAVLHARRYREEAVRFGPDGGLFGILCQPPGAHAGGPAIVLLNRGLNAHVGWRRGSVDLARGLAASGLTSLRIDVAGLGESRDEPGRPLNLIYSDRLLPDIAAAVDLLAARGSERIALVGVCSGAYMALRAAARDPRVTDLVAINTQRLVWNPAESVEDVIRYGLRSMHDYVGDIRSRGALAKLLRSRRRVLPAMRFLAKRGLKGAMARVPLGVRSLVGRDSMAARVERFFATVAARGTRVSLVYSAGDPGLVELRNYFGPNGRTLRHPNVTVTVLPGADHNLTTRPAMDWMLDHIVALACEGPRADGRAARPSAAASRLVGQARRGPSPAG